MSETATQQQGSSSFLCWSCFITDLLFQAIILLIRSESVFCFNSLSGCFFSGIQDKQDFCFRRHSIPFVRIVPQIDNQAAERSSELLQCKRTAFLLQESLDLGLFSSPAATQLLESQRTCIFAVLDHRSKNRKRMTGSLYTVWHQGTSHASDLSDILFPTASLYLMLLWVQINPYPYAVFSL